MALPSKSQPTQKLTFQGAYSDPPALPADVKLRFPSMAEWEKGLNRWWKTQKDMMARDRQAISDSVNLPSNA